MAERIDRTDLSLNMTEGAQSDFISPHDSVSQIGGRSQSHAGSVRSSVTSAKIKEIQRKAELNTKMKALEMKREIERDKLDLEREKLDLMVREERLLLQTELDISESKSQALNDMENLAISANPFQYIPTEDRQQPIADFSTDHGHIPINNYPGDERNINSTHYQHYDNPEHSFTNPFHPNYDIPATEQQIASVVRQLKKPVTEIKKFGGDPLEYKRFIRQFNSKIVINTDSDEERMTFLEQFTEDEANKIVSGFNSLDDSVGYSRALKELEYRYGNNEVLANAYVKRALVWPIIKSDNTKALDQFGIFLVECENAIHSIHAVRVLEYPENMRKLVTKLPYYFHDNWRGIVQKTKDMGDEVKFPQLVQFVKYEARKANDPTYGRAALQIQTESKLNKPNRAKSSYVTKVITDTHMPDDSYKQYEASSSNYNNDGSAFKRTAFTVPCMFCGSSKHSLEQCDELTKLSYQNKIDFLKENRLCFGCLKSGHRRQFCKSKATCIYCKSNHPSVCHVEGRPPQLVFQRKENVNKPTSAYVHVTGNAQRLNVDEGQCTLAIIPVSVKLKNSMNVVHTYAFLDPGSSASFCTDSLLRKLGGNGKPMQITLETMGATHKLQTQVVKGLQIGDLQLDSVIDLDKVYTKDKIPVSSVHILTSNDLQHWPHLNDIHLPIIHTDIGLLIGNDVPDAYTPLAIRTGERGCPHATKSLLGWIIWNVVRPPVSGKICDTVNVTVNRTTVTVIQEEQELKELDRHVRESVRLDFPEHMIDDRREHSIEDKRFTEKVDSSIKMVDGHYSIKLPFKRENVTVPSNELQARQRLNSLKTKMKNNEKFKGEYKTFMQNMLDKRYAERVPDEEIDRSEGKTWYIPHHGVYHPHKPEKIRVVFDCSVNYQGTCLNKILLQGPDLTNNLLSVLLRFRQESVAIMADIEAMFYQVKVPKEDCDYFRFLWWPYGDIDKQAVPFRMVVHLFGATSSPSCANAAFRKAVEDHSGQFPVEISEVMFKSFYVDDCLVSVESQSKAIQFIDGLTSICERGGFRLRKWVSNDRKILESIPEEEKAKDFKNLPLNCDSLPTERALGVQWSVERDTIGFNIKIRSHSATRRGILSTVSSVYDPFAGLASPFVLPAKLILQDLCRLKTNWDEKVTGRNLKKWEQWLTDLPQLDKIEVNRCYKPSVFNEVSNCQLHVFSDASDSGYGVAVYLRLTDKDERRHCCLVMGRSRVAPLKKVSIPRMELTAATMAVRLSRMIVRELDYHIDRVLFWTDSMSVLRYIANESTRFHTFVANRVAMIRDGSEPDQWRYIESKLNPADCASRGLTFNQLQNHNEWLDGPNFLWIPESEWPVNDQAFNGTQLLDNDPEVKKITTNVTQVNSDDSPLSKLIDSQSSWIKLRSIMGWVLMAVSKFKKRKPVKAQIIGIKDVKRDMKSVHLPFSFVQMAETVT